MKARLYSVAKISAIVLVLGLGYGLFCMATGLCVPCLFRQVTGYLCPGCGVTGLCLALMRLDVVTAYHCNPALFLASPLIGVLVVSTVVAYVKTGSVAPKTWQSVLTWCLIVYFLLWCLHRNGLV